MRRRRILFMTAGLTCLAIAGATVVARQTPAVRSVRVDVVVSDGHGPVAGLGPADFTIADNGVPQRLATALPVGRVAVALVLDGSANMRGTPWTTAVRAAQTFLSTLDPSDRAAVIATTDRLTIAAPMGRPQAAAAVLGGLPPAGLGRTLLWDATMAAASIAARDGGRALVVLLSNGNDRGSWSDETTVLDRLSEAGVLIDAVTVPGGGLGPAELPWSALAKLPGSVVVDSSDGSLAKIISRQVAALRAGYVLTFVPEGVKSGDGAHKLAVSLVHGKGDVLAREAYTSR